MTEIWKDVAGYEGIYQVSNIGRVKSFHRKTPLILKPMVGQKGYLRVELRHGACFGRKYGVDATTIQKIVNGQFRRSVS